MFKRILLGELTHASLEDSNLQAMSHSRKLVVFSGQAMKPEGGVESCLQICDQDLDTVSKEADP